MDIVIEKCKGFEELAPRTTHFITTRIQGFSEGNYSSCNLGQWCGEDSNITLKNKELLCNKLSIPIDGLFIPREIHNNNIVLIDKSFLANSKEENELLSIADAIICTEPNIAVAVSTADCVPILCTDNKAFVACIHAGWRGIISGVICNTIRNIKEIFREEKELYFMIGPCVGSKNYEVDKDVWNKFQQIFNDKEQRLILNKQTDTKYYPDLRIAATLQINMCCAKSSIVNFTADTFTDSRFYSVRRSGMNTGRFLTGIKLNKKD